MTRFGEISLVFGNFLTVYMVFGKIVNLLWLTFYAVGQIFNAVYDQKLKEYFSPSGHTVYE